MRLFVACTVPEEIKRILLDIQKKLLVNLDGSASKVSEFHLTLKFLGEVDESRAKSIISELSKLSFRNFQAFLSGIGFFPNQDYIRVIWAGLEPAKEIVSLQLKVDDVLSSFGFASENGFHPHLTIARVKFLRNKEGFLKSIGNIEIQEAGFEIKEFHLIKSTLTPSGPVYETLHSFSAK